MKAKRTVVVLASGLLAATVAYVEHRLDVASADTRIDMADPHAVAMKDSPIRRDWVLEGPAQAIAGEIGRTHDGSTKLVVWRVGKGRFNWRYDFDEAITILDGEVYLTDGADALPGNPSERRLGPGDVVLFHIGSVATWRVPDHIRKVATVKLAHPAPIASLDRLYKTMRGWVSRPAAAKAL